MRTIITVIEKVEEKENTFLCEMNILEAKKVFECEITLSDLYECFTNKKEYKIIYQTEVVFNTITIEEYEGEYDVNVNTYKLSESGENFQDNLIGTWKRNSTAITKANEYAKYNEVFEIISATM